jgi:two-component system nitrate/nitrite response regulator NarP
MTARAPRALIVEDDHSWQQIISEILSDCGLEVDAATNLNDATTRLKSQVHRLAVVDLSLSPNDHNNYDGLRVLEAIRRLDPNCSAILLTGFATVELAVTALTEYKVFTFLRKESFHRSQFREIVHRILVNPPIVATQITDTTSTSSPPANGSNGTLRTPREKALVVDDDAGWRSILDEILTDSGFLVRTCASFGDALGYLRKEKYSLAILDLSLQRTINNLPESNPQGYQLLATTRREHIPTIVVSGITEPGEIQRVYSEFAISAYIEKQAFARAAFRRLVEETRQNHEAQSELSLLTEREREVLDLLARGLTNKEIAGKLVITTNTVKRHLKAIFEKLNVHTRSAATAKVAGR